MKKRRLNSGIFLSAFLSFILLFAITLTASTALFYNNQEINGKISLGENIRINYTGTLKNTSGDLTFQYIENDEMKEFNITNAKPEDSYELVNPIIDSSSNETPLYMRARLSFKDNDKNEISSEDISEIFSELPRFNSSWNLKKDGWYYYSSSIEDMENISGKDLNKNIQEKLVRKMEKLTTAKSLDKDIFPIYGNVTLFEDNPTIRISSSENLYDVYEKIGEITLSLKIEYVEACEEGYLLWLNKEENEIPYLEESIDKEIGEISSENERNITDENIMPLVEGNHETGAENQSGENITIEDSINKNSVENNELSINEKNIEIIDEENITSENDIIKNEGILLKENDTEE